MKGHGIFLLHYAPGFEKHIGKIYSGYHMDRFKKYIES